MPSVEEGNDIHCSPKDPVPKKRGRGGLKGLRNKGFAEIGYKRANKNKEKVPQSGDVAKGANESIPTNKPKKMPFRRKAATQSIPDSTQVEFVVEDASLVAGTSTCISPMF